MNTSPTVLMPAEWESHDAIWLAWPHNQSTWPGRYERVPAAFAAMTRQIALTTRVCILADSTVAADAERFLAGIKNLELVAIATNDCWIRDYGPTFVRKSDGSLAGVDWRYNAWGGKYPPWDDDARAARQVLEHLGIERIESSLCLEGGAIESDGNGRLLITPECVLCESRNPGVTIGEAEAELTRCLGAREFIWLRGGGLMGDDTDGHIDQLARFVDAQNLVVATCDQDDPNFAALHRNQQQLNRWSQESSAGEVAIHALPLPPARWINDQRVPESYCNFLMTGGQVIVPTFSAPEADDRAIGILRETMQSYDVVAMDASTLSWGLGAMHCMSQQQPARAQA